MLRFNTDQGVSQINNTILSKNSIPQCVDEKKSTQQYCVDFDTMHAFKFDTIDVVSNQQENCVVIL